MGIVSVEKDDAIYVAERLGGVIIISMLICSQVHCRCNCCKIGKRKK